MSLKNRDEHNRLRNKTVAFMSFARRVETNRTLCSVIGFNKTGLYNKATYKQRDCSAR